MYTTIASLVLLGLSLAWTALNKSGVSPFSWYVSLVLIGLAMMVFWSRPRRTICPPLPAWVIWTIRGLTLYLIFQAIPLPLPLLSIVSPARAAFTRALAPVLGEVSSGPISVDPAAHILWFLTMAGCTAAFFLVRDLTFRLQSRLFVVLTPVLAVAVFEALLGLVQIAGGAEQATGTYNNRDHYCCILEMTLPLAIAAGLVFFGRKTLMPSVWPAVKAAACWILAGVLMLGILFSLSRAGWGDSLVSLIVLGSLVLFPQTKTARWRVTVLAGFLVLAFAVFLIASPDAMLGRLAGTMAADSNGRIYIWRELVPLTKEFRWFGTGLMGFDPVFLKYQAFVNSKRIDFAHNDFLQYLIELGIVGFMPLVASLGAVVWPIARDSWAAPAQSESRAEIRLLQAGCLAGMTALFLHSLVDFNLYVPANLFGFAWILGVGSGLSAIMTVKLKECRSEV